MEQTLDIKSIEKDAVVLDLIKGQFTTEETRDILMHMIQKKIDFHEMKIFSEEIRFGKKDHPSIKRVEELRISKNKIRKIVEAAQANGLQVKINSTIQIELF